MDVLQSGREHGNRREKALGRRANSGGIPRLMREASETYKQPVRWGLAGSLLLHAAFCTILILMPSAPTSKPLPEQSVEVEFVTLPPPASPAKNDVEARSPGAMPSLVSPGGGVDLSTAMPSVTGDGSTGPKPPTMVKPTLMLSSEVLADPRSRRANMKLSQLATEDQVTQLCSIEAMAQIRSWNRAFQPDFVITYAMADASVSGNSLLADGAAFHSKQQWYNLKFKCDLTPDRKKIVAFEFLVGDAIPRNEWEIYNLPVRIAPAD